MCHELLMHHKLHVWVRTTYMWVMIFYRWIIHYIYEYELHRYDSRTTYQSRTTCMMNYIYESRSTFKSHISYTSTNYVDMSHELLVSHRLHMLHYTYESRTKGMRHELRMGHTFHIRVHTT